MEWSGGETRVVGSKPQDIRTHMERRTWNVEQNVDWTFELIKDGNASLLYAGVCAMMVRPLNANAKMLSKIVEARQPAAPVHPYVCHLPVI